MSHIFKISLPRSWHILSCPTLCPLIQNNVHNYCLLTSVAVTNTGRLFIMYPLASFSHIAIYLQFFQHSNTVSNHLNSVELPTLPSSVFPLLDHIAGPCDDLCEMAVVR